MHRGNEPVVEAMGKKFIAVAAGKGDRLCDGCAGDDPGSDTLCSRLPNCMPLDEDGWGVRNIIFKEVD